MRVVVGASQAAVAAALPWHWPLSTVPHNIINDDDRLLCYLLVSGLLLSSSSASQRDLSFMCTSGNSWDDIFLQLLSSWSQKDTIIVNEKRYSRCGRCLFRTYHNNAYHSGDFSYLCPLINVHARIGKADISGHFCWGQMLNQPENIKINQSSGTYEINVVPVRLFGRLLGGSLGSISLMLAEDTLLSLPGRKQCCLPALFSLSLSSSGKQKRTMAITPTRTRVERRSRKESSGFNR